MEGLTKAHNMYVHAYVSFPLCPPTGLMCVHIDPDGGVRAGFQTAGLQTS